MFDDGRCLYINDHPTLIKIQTMGTKARQTQTEIDTHVAPLAMGRSKSRVAPSQSGVHVCFLLYV